MTFRDSDGTNKERCIANTFEHRITCEMIQNPKMLGFSKGSLRMSSIKREQDGHEKNFSQNSARWMEDKLIVTICREREEAVFRHAKYLDGRMTSR